MMLIDRLRGVKMSSRVSSITGTGGLSHWWDLAILTGGRDVSMFIGAGEQGLQE